MRNLHNFLTSCEEDLKPYQKLIDDFKRDQQNLGDKFNKQIPKHMREGKTELNRLINQFFDTLGSHQNDAAQMNNQLKAFHGKLGKEFDKIANEQLQTITNELIKDFSSSVNDTYTNSLLHQIHDFKLDTITEKVEAGTRSGTKKRNAGWGALAGGVAGFFLGGPAGAAIGAGIGSGLGSATGDSASIRYREIQITVGDNLQEIRHKLINIYGDAFDRTLKEGSSRLWNDFDGSIQTLLNKISSDIKKFDSELQKIRQKSQTSLQH